jgi:hypothetical protein
MKLPNQSQPVLRTGMESMKSNPVNPSGIACTICRTGCSLLSGIAKTVCETGCSVTVC